MKRRTFVTTGLAGTLAGGSLTSSSTNRTLPSEPNRRDQYPRTLQEIYLNAAALMPLSRFSQMGLNHYLKFQQMGPATESGTYFRKMWSELRPLFAQLIGADVSEIGLVHCTKAGEQIALDAVDDIKKNGTIVTNDLHFTGSLHNLVGLQKSGRKVHIVRAEQWKINPEAMLAAIDDQTALVCLSLVSNINGHMEEIRAITEKAHRHGALVYADIIQAAGIVPIDAKAMGFDLAACSCYKWLHGVYGSGFLYVKKEIQGNQIRDRLFPGSVRHNYAPWVEEAAPDSGDFKIHPREDATRYQPGHVNYMGYCAAYEGLKFLLDYGIENALAHSVRLNQRLKSKLDPDRYPCISPHLEKTPIITLMIKDPKPLKKALADNKIVATLAGNRLRISPGIYNNEDDIDALSDVLMAHAKMR